MPETKRRSPVRWWVWVVIALVVVALVAALIRWWQPISDFLSNPEQVRDWVEGLGAWGSLAIILLEILQALVAFIPGQAVEAVSGYLYGPIWGTMFAMTGIVIGSLITFSLARRFGRPLVVRLIGRPSMDQLDDLVRRGGAPFFFLIWLFPLAPDDLACIAAGLTPMPTRKFLTLMILGRLPGIFVSVWVGANAERIDPILWVVLTILIAIVALVLWRWGTQIQEAVLGFIERLSNRLEGDKSDE
jgi:uncharacterized membrane protein YdjX (TVP38/TMEM64 family)